MSFEHRETKPLLRSARHGAAMRRSVAGWIAVASLVALAACARVLDPGAEGGREEIARLLVSHDVGGTPFSELQGLTVSGTVRVVLDATELIAEASFHLNGDLDAVAVATSHPLAFDLDTTEMPDGPHTVTAATSRDLVESSVVAEAEFTVDNSGEREDPPPGEVEEPDDSKPLPPGSFVTRVSIDGDRWLLNGVPTNAGSVAEGLLLNSRMVQATFEDSNPATVGNWAYPDGAPYDPERQTAEFIAMVPMYAAHGLNAVTLSLQGGRPMPGTQVWINSAFAPDGALRASYMERVARVIEALDRHGMVAIVSYFYFGQDQNLEDESAIFRATRDATDWLVDRGYTNVIVELVNEAGHRHYDHDVLGAGRVHELVEAAREVVGDRLMLSASMGGGKIPPSSLMRVSDYHLLHGNNQTARRVAEMVDEIRSKAAYGGQPIVFNEDSTDLDNMAAAVAAGASWGYYDQGDNDYLTGYQSPPTNWTLSTPAKRAFFEEVQWMTSPSD